MLGAWPAANPQLTVIRQTKTAATITFRVRGKSMPIRKLRVFIVDDEPVIAMTLTAILSMNGYDALAFMEATKALDAIELGPPDLLISEVSLPRLTGVELAIRVKARCPTCLILLVSGQATTEILSSAQQLGHTFELLAKPVTPPYLLNFIHRVFNS